MEEVASEIINYHFRENSGVSQKYISEFSKDGFYKANSLNKSEYVAENTPDLIAIGIYLFKKKYPNKELQYSDYSKFILCIEEAYKNLSGVYNLYESEIKKQGRVFLSEQDIPHNHGENIIGYDPSYEAFQRLKLKQLAKSAVGIGDVLHHLEEGLLDPSNTPLVFDSKNEIWVPINFGHGQGGDNDHHSHDQYLPHISTNLVGMVNSGNSTNSFLSLNRMSNNGFHYAISSNFEFEKVENVLGSKMHNSVFRGYKPISQDADGFRGLDVAVIYNDSNHEADENKPIYLPHHHPMAIFEGKSLEAYVGIKNTQQFFTHAMGLSRVFKGKKDLFGLKAETSFRIPSLAGFGFFTTTALYSEKINFNGGYGGSHFGLGINFEQHGKVSFLNPLAHIKLSRNEIIAEGGELEKNINAEFTYNAPINKFLSLSANANIEKSADETHQTLNSYLQITPARNFYFQVGYDASKKTEILDGLEEVSNAGNIFLGAGVIHNAVNINARVNFTNDEAGRFSNTGVVSVNASYNFNLTKKKVVKD
ncbi:MAG: hypothetical protein SFT90_08030 [Rickettsiales bacterium]|nr:hypothetical protein [Rickettsiales bacterium]